MRTLLVRNRWVDALLLGWLFGAMMAFYFIGHPLLHSEFAQPAWRAIVLPRVFAGAPWVFGVPFVGTLVAVAIGRSGGETARVPRRHPLLPALLLIAVTTAADVALLLFYARLLH